MSENIFYHVVTERPMSVGQVIKFDENHHSGVFERVMEKLPQVEEIYSQPKISYCVSLEHHLSVALRELALEEIRKSEFPQYPSRMSCLYVSQSQEEAEKWFEFFSGIRPTFQIVKIKVNGRVFRGNAELCFDGTPDKEENLRLAKKYWQLAESDSEPIWEILVDGELEVLEILKEN